MPICLFTCWTILFPLRCCALLYPLCNVACHSQVFFFFFWKGRGFGGVEGGEKEVQEVGKEKKNSEKKGKVEWRMWNKEMKKKSKDKGKTGGKKEEKRKKRKQKEDKHVTTLKQMGIYKITKVSRGASRSSKAVCQQAPLHCSRRPPSVAHWDSFFFFFFFFFWGSTV